MKKDGSRASPPRLARRSRFSRSSSGTARRAIVIAFAVAICHISWSVPQIRSRRGAFRSGFECSSSVSCRGRRLLRRRVGGKLI